MHLSLLRLKYECNMDQRHLNEQKPDMISQDATLNVQLLLFSGYRRDVFLYGSMQVSEPRLFVCMMERFLLLLL